jgi:3-hydroxyanthranilate 3,4-dioxygenase
LGTWYEENKAVFSPPVCNKLMHKDQLTVMFVGGPNTRTDFHLDEGSEFFYQMRGNMELPIIEQGKRKLVHIREGQVFLLPSRVPHSPQRPEGGSLGLVVERRRYEATESDGLRWYVNFDECKEVLYERHFYCDDLGRDLVPVIKRFQDSDAYRSGRPQPDSIPVDTYFSQDLTTKVPDPFYLQDWLQENEAKLSRGAELNLFEGHPDGEFNVKVIGGSSTQSASWEHETFFYQLKGDIVLQAGGKSDGVTIPQDGCFVVDSGVPYTVTRPEGSLGLVVTNDPMGNKKLAV